MKHKISSRKGFSLVEVVIAIGIVAVLLTTFMAVFGPAQKNINKALGVAEANRLISTLENEMAILRPGEEGDYSSAFDKAFEWVKDSPDESSGIVVYQYHAHPKNVNADGTLKAADITVITDDLKMPGVDYITQTVARRLDKSKSLELELAPGVVQGKVYAVRMTQLVKSTPPESGLILGEASEVVNSDGSVANKSDLLEDAYITLQVEFYPLNTTLFNYVTGGSWNFDKLGSPVATQNIAIRR